MGSRPSWIVPLAEAARAGDGQVGGKAARLGSLVQSGFRVPRGFCITTSAYEHFVAEAGLGSFVAMELGRKPLDAMRWEELWDARDNENFQLNDTFSKFVPDLKGSHDFKFGGTYHRTRLTPGIQNNLGGTFRFATDLPFNAADPRTYPERFLVRVGDPRGFTFDVKTHTYELFFQDKWVVSKRLTIGLGIRYDLEVFPFDIKDNPLIPSGDYPVDKNNFSPRTSFAYDVKGDGKSVLRGGYGIFDDKTLIESTDNILEAPKFSRKCPIRKA